MKKIILWLLGLLILFSVGIFVASKTMPYFAPSYRSVGDLVFANADKLTRIIVYRGKEKIKLRKKDGSWLVNGYYGSNAAVEEYLRKLQQAKIVSADVAMLPQPQTKLRLDGGAQKRFFLMAAAAEKPDQSLVGIDGRNYLLSENVNPPTKISDYYVQPLLPFGEHKLEQVVGLPREAAEELLTLPCRGAFPHLPKKVHNAEHKSFAAVTEDGIKIIFGIYKYQENYRLTVNLKTTIMPTESAAEFVRKNGFRYNGWFFVLSHRDGSRLFNLLKND